MLNSPQTANFFVDVKMTQMKKNRIVLVCPVCMGYPGAMPYIQKEAMGKVLKIGSAVSGEFADFTEFDRKHYFYPDIPQLSSLPTPYEPYLHQAYGVSTAILPQKSLHPLLF